MNKNIFILYHASKNHTLTYDCILRMEAAALYATKNQNAHIFFVGGGGKNPSGAQQMRIYWNQHFSSINTATKVCDNSNTSISNIEEIQKNVTMYPGHHIIMTNAYHVPRIQKMMKKYHIPHSIVIAVEDILLNNKKREIVRYKKSYRYKMKQCKEFILSQLFFCESFFRFIRRILYRIWK